MAPNSDTSSLDVQNGSVYSRPNSGPIRNFFETHSAISTATSQVQRRGTSQYTTPTPVAGFQARNDDDVELSGEYSYTTEGQPMSASTYNTLSSSNSEHQEESARDGQGYEQYRQNLFLDSRYPVQEQRSYDPEFILNYSEDEPSIVWIDTSRSLGIRYEDVGSHNERPFGGSRYAQQNTQTANIARTPTARWVTEYSTEERMRIGLPRWESEQHRIDYQRHQNRELRSRHARLNEEQGNQRSQPPQPRGINGPGAEPAYGSALTLRELPRETILREDAEGKEKEQLSIPPAAFFESPLALHGSKEDQVNQYLPSEEQRLQAFPARNPVPGENRPYELATGRQTTAPRRRRRPEAIQRQDGMVAQEEDSPSHNDRLGGSSSGLQGSVFNETLQSETQSLATGRHVIESRISRRSQSGQHHRSQGTAGRKQQTSSRHDVSNSSIPSQQAPQLVLQSFSQPSLDSPRYFSMPPHGPNYQAVHQEFAAPSTLQAPVTDYYEDHRQPPGDLWNQGYQSQTFSELPSNDQSFSPGFENLETQGHAQFNVDRNNSLPGLSSSSMTPPSDQSFPDSNNDQIQTSSSTVTPSQPKPEGECHSEEWPDCFEEFVDFGGLG